MFFRQITATKISGSGISAEPLGRRRMRQILRKHVFTAMESQTKLPRGLRHGSATARCWDCGFKSRRWHGCLSLVNVVCSKVEVSATDRFVVQRGHTGRVCVCVFP